jgi:hypothetical protein
MDVRLPALLLVFATAPALAGTPKPHVLQVADLQALTGAPPSVILQPTKAMAIIGMQPAPVPNPDIDPPHGSGPAGPSLEPAFLSPKLEFQGDGFSHASNRDYGIDQRTQPAAGLNLSVPVK